MDQRPFLTAKWLDLVMLNWEIDPRALSIYIPSGVELDTWEQKAYLSVVAFRFEGTKVYGLSIPFHRNFEELNLRFYVRREVGGELRRGVVFIKEVVPKRLVSLIAKILYNENYAALPMSHTVKRSKEEILINYSWYCSSQPQMCGANIRGVPVSLKRNSREEFIAEHYWGYCRQRNGGTIEYKVEHPPWRVWTPSSVTFSCDAQNLYGLDFAKILCAPPAFALVADGSEVKVYPGLRIV